MFGSLFEEISKAITHGEIVCLSLQRLTQQSSHLKKVNSLQDQDYLTFLFHENEPKENQSGMTDS